MVALRGMYGGAGPDGMGRKAAFDKWAGAPTDAVSDGLARDNWANCISVADWAASLGWAKFRGFKCVAVPLCMGADAGGYDLAGAAAGTYNAKYRSLLTTIRSRNVGNLILRPGWEFNGGWYGWGVNAPPSWTASAARAALFVQAYRQFAAVAREVLPNALLDWNSAAGNYGVTTQSFYPGDDVVDIVGMDVYDVIDPDVAYTDAQRWNFHKTRTNGLDWLAAFAAAHKRPISIPEWGCGYKKATSGTANVSRDSAYFIQQMAAWIAGHNVFYANYFHYPASDGQWQLGADVPLWTNIPGSTGTPKQFPNASAAYKTIYGVTLVANIIDTDLTNLTAAVAALDAADAAVTTAINAQTQAASVVAAAQADRATKKQAVAAALATMTADVQAF